MFIQKWKGRNDFFLLFLDTAADLVIVTQLFGLRQRPAVRFFWTLSWSEWSCKDRFARTEVTHFVIVAFITRGLQ